MKHLKLFESSISITNSIFDNVLKSGYKDVDINNIDQAWKESTKDTILFKFEETSYYIYRDRIFRLRPGYHSSRYYMLELLKEPPHIFKERILEYIDKFEEAFNKI